jgi:predicted DNA-binding protein YlxM (UPF0122 family)
MTDLPIKPIYSLREIADACRVDRRALRKVLDRAGVEVFGGGKLAFVSLAEIERKVPQLFDGIRAAHALLRSLE